jgi:hypothetical protein
MARHFAANLDSLPEGESAAFLCEIVPEKIELKGVAAAVAAGLKGKTVLGLPVRFEVPSRPEGPALACKVTIAGTRETPEATVLVSTSGTDATAWAPAGKFTLALARDGDRIKATEFADALAEGVLGRMVRASLARGPKVKGKTTYKIRIENSSPLVLNGIAVLGNEPGKDEPAKVLSGICVSPGRSFTLPATGQIVEQLGLKKGVRVSGADLSGL